MILRGFQLCHIQKMVIFKIRITPFNFGILVQGHSRYDLMTNMAVPMSYKNLDSCGHLLFTTKPLMQPYEITGWVTIKLWISSNAKDVDIFCYLESLDPKSGSIEWVFWFWPFLFSPFLLCWMKAFIKWSTFLLSNVLKNFIVEIQCQN